MGSKLWDELLDSEVFYPPLEVMVSTEWNRQTYTGSGPQSLDY